MILLNQTQFEPNTIKNMLLLLVSLYPLYLTYILSQDDGKSMNGKSMNGKSMNEKYMDFVRVYWTLMSLMTLLEIYIGGFFYIGWFLGWFKLLLLLGLYNEELSMWLMSQVRMIDLLMLQYVPSVWKYDKQLQQQLFGIKYYQSPNQFSNQIPNYTNSVISRISVWLRSGFGGLF